LSSQTSKPGDGPVRTVQIFAFCYLTARNISIPEVSIALLLQLNFFIRLI